jgi:hypothetical protein
MTVAIDRMQSRSRRCDGWPEAAVSTEAIVGDDDRRHAARQGVGQRAF